MHLHLEVRNIYINRIFLPQTAYVDVCDDTSHAWRAKSLMNRAVDANVPAITTAGIYPGVSNGAYLFICIVLMFPNQNQNYMKII